MDCTESQWKTPDGTNLHVYSWNGLKAPKGVICLVHGLGEHAGRYTHVAQALTDAGYEMLGFDLPGHGKSDGKRGSTGSYEKLMEHISRLLSEAHRAYPGLPRYLYGHSMGGNLALYYLLRQKPAVQGAIITSPGLQPGQTVAPAKLFLGKIMCRLAPQFTMSNGLDLMNLSHDPQVIQVYQDDPLVHDKISAEMGINMIRNGAWIIDHAAECKVPLLLMQGSADHLVPPTATQSFAEKATGCSLTYKIWDGFYHETHNEPQKSQVLQTMIDWLDQQVNPA